MKSVFFNESNCLDFVFVFVFVSPMNVGKLHLEIGYWQILTLEKDSFARFNGCGAKKFAAHCIGSDQSVEYWCAGEIAVRFVGIEQVN